MEDCHALLQFPTLRVFRTEAFGSNVKGLFSPTFIIHDKNERYKLFALSVCIVCLHCLFALSVCIVYLHCLTDFLRCLCVFLYMQYILNFGL